VKKPRHGLLTGAALAIAVVVLAPILVLCAIAFSGGADEWAYLVRSILPRASGTTAWLLFLVAGSTAVIGVAAAWLVVTYDFPMRRIFSWALVLPMAVPPYLAAYAFAEFFLFTGPVQGLIRDLFGYTSIRDYWFPDIRSTGGAAFVLASVLYPYVYLTTRVVFLMQGRAIGDVARTLGAGPARVFFRVLLPVARPAIAAGLGLVVMECLNDVGATEYLGVQTLTVSVYTTWLNRGSLAGGAQVAMVLMGVVLLLLGVEHGLRHGRRVNAGRSAHLKARPGRVRLDGLRGALVAIVLAAPIACGFGIPVAVFGTYALETHRPLWSPTLAGAFLNSLAVASATALVTVGLALLLTGAARTVRAPSMPATVRLASAGYALPGGIVGLGLLIVLARLDNWVDAGMRGAFGVSTGLILTGSAAAIVLACTIRFLALAEGALRSGMEKLPPNLHEAALSLGRTPLQSARSVILPLLRPAVLTALVLVFVDTIKELSATILLRPFGFNTLATFIYENASRGAPQDGAGAALLVIATALVPVMLLSRALARDQHT
jgi:iron(III) transport system permease protein